MKANELRIGNWIHSSSLNKDRQVWSFYDLHYFLENMKPIELTEEWLIKLGFKDKQEEVENCNINYTYSKNPQFWIQKHTEVDEHIFYGLNNSIEVFIKSVHQLQNLFYCLTGKELTINK